MTKIAVLLAVLLVIAGAQETRWVYRYDGPGSAQDVALALMTGPDGNLYAAGLSTGDGTDHDFAVASLTPDGTERWIYRYDGTAGSQDRADGLVIGPDSCIYAAGVTNNTATSTDFTVTSLTPDGAERWVYKYDGPAGTGDAARAVALGRDGNIYAAGYSSGTDTRYDFTVISLDRAGNERWVYRYNGPGNGLDIANSVAVGPDGNVYAAGYSTGDGTREDITVISLNSDGTERWLYRYDGPARLRDMAHAVTVGPDSNLYVAGFIRGMRSAEFGVISLTPDGTERWVYRHNGPGDESDVATSVAVGPDGNIYAAGTRANSSSNYDFTVISLKPDGEERWIYTHGGLGNSADAARALTIGPDNFIYASGYVHNGSGRAEDFTVINLDLAGTERWVYYYNGPSNNRDDAVAITTGPDGKVYAAGYSTGSGTGQDLTVIALDPAGAVAEPAPRPVPELPGLTAAAFQGRRLEYSLNAPGPGLARLALMDLQGRKITDWELKVEAGISRHERPMPTLAAGVYFLTANLPGTTTTGHWKLAKTSR